MKAAKPKSGISLDRFTLGEIDSVHDWIGRMFRSFGLTGLELDEATAACFSPAVKAIDKHRAAKAAKRPRLKLVH